MSGRGLGGVLWCLGVVLVVMGGVWLVSWGCLGVVWGFSGGCLEVVLGAGVNIFKNSPRILGEKFPNFLGSWEEFDEIQLRTCCRDLEW